MSDLTLEQCQKILDVRDGECDELFLSSDESISLLSFQDDEELEEHLWDLMVVATESHNLTEVKNLIYDMENNLGNKYVVEGEGYRMFLNTASELQKVLNDLQPIWI